MKGLAKEGFSIIPGTVVFFSFFLFACSQNKVLDEPVVSGVETPKISLNGTWKFSLTPPDQFWDINTTIEDWADIEVPGECAMQGFAVKHDQPCAYKRDFLIPEDFKDKQILLNFYGVYSHARVWLNGQFIREHYGGFTRWECDITDYVIIGEIAQLTVEVVDRVDDISYGSGYAKHQIGGILRDVELVALPKQNFKQLYFVTDLDENYQHATLKVFYHLSQTTPTDLEIEVINAENQVIASKKKKEVSVEGELIIHIDDPLKWDAEHPNLYTVTAAINQDREELMVVPTKIGFREILVEGNTLLVNGQPVKLRGACRHDIHPLLGRMTTPEYDKKDVLLAKEANMNFIRTSHYPPSEAFLHYCDEYGIYVEDETAVCFVGSHRTSEYRKSGASQDDPEYQDWYLSQLKEMVDNHRNHPSVILWSIGNENTFGDNFVASFKWIKENDTTRPVIYSYPGQVPDSLKMYEILSMHYPDWKGNLDQYGVVTEGFSFEKMPVLFDEWAHVACYNNPTLKYDPNVRSFWGQSLDSMWTKLFEAEGGLGGAIWCMLDETFMLSDTLAGFNEWWGILDPKVIPSIYLGPCVGYGEWGIVDTWRRKKPEFWATKKAYSPTKVLLKQIDGFFPGQEIVLPVHNRFDHTDFNELKIVWSYADQTGDLDAVHLGPHQKGELGIPGMDWKAGEKIGLSFFQNDTFLVDAYQIQLGTRTVDLPGCLRGDLKVQEYEDLVSVKGEEFSLIINKNSGLLEDVVINNDTLIQSGPYINLKIPGKPVQYSTIVMDNMAENWQCEDCKYEVKDGILYINSSGKYDQLSADFFIQVDETGTIIVAYEVKDGPFGTWIQEQGLLFFTGDQFQKVAWDRNAYFTVYPAGDIGMRSGEVDLTEKPTMKYREYPEHDWGYDMKNFYYQGLEKELPYPNIARSMKEYIYSFTLKTKANAKLQVLAQGSKACRFDKIDSENVLLINDQWDYNSLLWGNYMNRIKSKEKFQGVVVMEIGSS